MVLVLHLRTLTDEERSNVARLIRAESTPRVRLVRRARIIHLASEGLTTPAIAREWGISEKAVRRRLQRVARLRAWPASRRRPARDARACTART